MTVIVRVANHFKDFLIPVTQKVTRRDFPDDPVVKNLPSMQGMQVQSLVREPRSHRHGATKPAPQLEGVRAATRECEGHN